MRPFGVRDHLSHLGKGREESVRVGTLVAGGSREPRGRGRRHCRQRARHRGALLQRGQPAREGLIIAAQLLQALPGGGKLEVPGRERFLAAVRQ